MTSPGIYKQEPGSCRDVYDTPEAVELYSHRILWAVEQHLFENYLRGSGRICDIACAAGRMSMPLAGMGDYDLIGFDISFNQVLQARQAADESNARCWFFQCDMTRIGLHDESMDYVFVTYTSLGALTRRKDRELSLSEIRRIVKPKGLVFISVWNRRWPGKLGISWLKWGVIHLRQCLGLNNHGFGNRVCWEDGGCVLWHYFTYPEAASLFRKSGFEIVDAVPFQGSWNQNSVLHNNWWNRHFAEGIFFVLERML